MERVNLKADTPAASFLRAALGRRKIEGLFAQVELRVNGAVVPFEEIVDEMFNHSDAVVRERAMQLLEGSELVVAFKALQDAKLRIREAVKSIP